MFFSIQPSLDRDHFIDGPSTLGGPYPVTSEALSFPSQLWLLPISLDSQSRHVFFEVPNPSRFPGLRPAVSPTSSSHLRRSSASCSLGMLERTTSSIFSKQESCLSDRDEDNYPLSHRTLLGITPECRNRSAARRKRSIFSPLPPIEVSSLSEGPRASTIKQLESAWNESLEERTIESLCLTDTGYSFGWFSIPGQYFTMLLSVSTVVVPGRFCIFSYSSPLAVSFSP